MFAEIITCSYRTPDNCLFCYQLHCLPLRELYCEGNNLLQHLPVHSEQEEEVLSLKVIWTIDVATEPFQCKNHVQIKRGSAGIFGFLLYSILLYPSMMTNSGIEITFTAL
jgi:hypothetical protein